MDLSSKHIEGLMLITKMCKPLRGLFSEMERTMIYGYFYLKALRLYH